MRRKEKEITNPLDIEKIIRSSILCRLAMVDGDRPYVVPLNFGYEKQTLYFHGAMSGKKLNLIKTNNNVCFEFDHNCQVVEAEEACEWSMKFQSVIGFGKTQMIEGIEEKRQALAIIMKQYSNRSFEFSEKHLKGTAVFKVDIDSMTGKQAGW